MASVTAHNHQCLVYESDRDHHTAVLTFLQEGLTNGEKIIYIFDQYHPDTLLDFCAQADVNAEYWMKRGQLLFVSADETYCREPVFQPYTMVGYLCAETVKALSQRYTGIRITGEMSWAISQLRDLDALLQYEMEVTTQLPAQCIGLCQYDRRAFPADVLLDLVSLHPVIISHNKPILNPLSQVSTELLDDYFSDN